MDPLTHSALGAAAAGALLGKKEGMRAVVCGALAGALPDVDIIPTLFMDPLSQIDLHRGFTHSILFALLLSALFGYIANRMMGKKTGIDLFMTWSLIFFVAILSHIVLDCFTSYGTRIFLPFSDYRVALGTIAVVDPLFTIPIMAAALSLLAFKNNDRLRRILLTAGLAIGSAYLGATVLNKLYIDSVFNNNLKKQKIEYSRFMTTPMPFSNLLWVGIAEGNNYYYTGYHSILDRDDSISFERDKKNHDYINGLAGNNSIKKLISFAKDFYTVESMSGDIIFNDLRYGSIAAGSGKKEFIFSYVIKHDDCKVKIVRKTRSRVTPDSFKLLLKRMAGEKEEL